MDEVYLYPPSTCEDSADIHPNPSILSWLSKLPLDWSTDFAYASHLDEVIDGAWRGAKDFSTATAIPSTFYLENTRKRKRSLSDNSRHRRFVMAQQPDLDETISIRSAPTIISSFSRITTNSTLSNRPILVPRPPSTRTSGSNSTSPTRSKSPTRVGFVALPNASSPVTICLAHKVSNPEPEQVTIVRKTLIEATRRPVPWKLKNQLESHLQNVTYEDCDLNDKVRNDDEKDIDIAALWKDITRVYAQAAECNEMKMDENAWIDVIRSMLRVEGLDDMSTDLRVHSVQTQAVNTDHLPLAQMTNLPISRMVDLTLAIPPKNNLALANWHKDNPGRALSHLKDAYTASVPLVCPIEVKSTSGNRDEAYCQVAVWSAAALANMESLRDSIGVGSRSMITTAVDLSPLPPPSPSLPYLGFVVIGHVWELTITWKAANGDVTVFQPIASTLFGDTSSYLGIFKLWRLIQGVKRWLLATWWQWYKIDVLGCSEEEE